MKLILLALTLPFLLPSCAALSGKEVTVTRHPDGSITGGITFSK